MVTLFITCFNSKFLRILLTECICGYCIIVGIDSDYFFKQLNQLTFVMVKFSIWGTDWILRQYFEYLRGWKGKEALFMSVVSISELNTFAHYYNIYASRRNTWMRLNNVSRVFYYASLQCELVEGKLLLQSEIMPPFLTVTTYPFNSVYPISKSVLP